ncbi:MAG: YifB family Mg chelatase-like AAA ATPase [Deltaproteobacteria bacterium]|nr:YifB family Mg chelatase-like AAA ATPase [Deltaproteobacteria bacterium]
MTRVLGAVLSGVDGIAVEVEVRIGSQLPRIEVIGLPEAAVRESAARVRAAVHAAGHRIPERRVTVNLAPASVRKSGAGLDLPIAIGVLAASGAVEATSLPRLGLVGELALDGRLRPVRGALALALALRDAGCKRVVVPRANGGEAALTPGLAVLPADDLGTVLRFVQTGLGLAAVPPIGPERLPAPTCAGDLAEVRGQARAKRALEIAAAGGHGLLLEGPPGSGKTMLARRLPGLLPPLAFAEAVEATRIHGAAGRLGDAPIVRERPFRAPHHAASRAGLLGGGSPPRPGEASLAHHGVLFLDELPEFERTTLESLRQVLEERRVVVARAGGTCVFPADFQLVAAANPCPCGWRLSRFRDCSCSDASIARYLARVSGPLLDRIDLHVSVPAVAWRELASETPAGEASALVRARVLAARARQRERLDRHGLRTNAEIADRALDLLVDAAPEARALLGRAVEKLRLSARAARRLLRVARTIADLEGAARVGAAPMAEALGYRREGDAPGPP